MINNYLSLIKFSHTIFALPFALIGFFIGVLSKDNSFDVTVLFLVVLCMIFARSAAMAFNRYIDRDIDKINPRSATREIPSGVISERNAILFVVLNSFLFVFTTYFINKICFYLSPIALAVILGYSLTKRFTFLCHVVLGLGLALAPVGSYLAVTGEFGIISVLLGLAVLFWVSGFDIIYALQDESFDKDYQLFSIPSYFGGKKALIIAKVLHVCCITLLSLATYLTASSFPQIGLITYVGLLSFILLIIYQHSVVKYDDLSRVNMAFFTTNGIASLIFGSLFLIDYVI